MYQGGLNMIRVGDKVKVARSTIDGYKRGFPSYLWAKVVEMQQNAIRTMYMIEVDGHDAKYLVDRCDLLEAHTISKEDLERFAKSELPVAEALIRKTIGALLPQHTKDIQNHSDMISVGCYSIMPCVIERKSIGALTEIHGWNLSQEVQIPATMWEPPTSDVNTVFENHSLFAVVGKLLTALFSDNVAGYMEQELGLIEASEVDDLESINM